jgi:hypothetical protein
MTAPQVGDVVELRDWPHTAHVMFGREVLPRVRMKVVRAETWPHFGDCVSGWTDESADGSWTLWRTLPLDRLVVA